MRNAGEDVEKAQHSRVLDRSTKRQSHSGEHSGDFSGSYTHTVSQFHPEEQTQEEQKCMSTLKPEYDVQSSLYESQSASRSVASDSV